MEKQNTTAQYPTHRFGNKCSFSSSSKTSRNHLHNLNHAHQNTKVVWKNTHLAKVLLLLHLFPVTKPSFEYIVIVAMHVRFELIVCLNGFSFLLFITSTSVSS